MKKKIVTIIIHLICWIFFLLFPVVFSPKDPNGITGKIDLLQSLPLLFSSIILILIFYINYYILIPKFLFTKKYTIYVLLCIICFIIIRWLPHIIMAHSPDESVFHDEVFKRIGPLTFAINLLMFIVAYLASTGLAINNRLRQAEKERLNAQLSYLKTQINPHFLFNTLNSIYSVTIGKAPQAAEMVSKLSEMMRYTLKETQHEFIPLEKEIGYIENYIDLQRVRFDNSVKFSYKIEGNYSDKQIAPLLLIPFIENAFKHGVNSEQNSNIEISISIKANELNLQVFNNKVKMEKNGEDKSGMGIENTKHRLLLIYPSRHLLTITETEKDFNVSLHINLQ